MPTIAGILYQIAKQKDRHNSMLFRKESTFPRDIAVIYEFGI